jgi:hypothetical protein
LVSLLAVLAGSSSAAGVCEGSPADTGTTVSGPVLEIPDGASLCVALGPSRSTWIPVQLATLTSSRSALMAAAFGKNATCIVEPDGHGQCLIEGVPLGDALRSPALASIAMSWR